jgi:osmotically-inducible protein OsmY
VTKREGERAAQLASKVNGVRKVVTLFEVVN